MALPRRIVKETQRLQQEPVAGISCAPYEDNLRYFRVSVDSEVRHGRRQAQCLIENRGAREIHNRGYQEHLSYKMLARAGQRSLRLLTTGGVSGNISIAE
eukprot:g4390.t1